VSALFRREAVEGQRQSWLGDVRLVRPLPVTLLTAFAVGVAASSLTFLFVGEMTRKARLTGVLVTASAEAGGPLQAQLFAPPEAVGLLRPDQTVLLRYEAFGPTAGSRESGKIVAVARTPESTGAVCACAGASGAAPSYRVVAALDEQQVIADGRPQALAVGMRVEAEVLLERRRLIDWLFAPSRV
jgi:hypothetical protein